MMKNYNKIKKEEHNNRYLKLYTKIYNIPAKIVRSWILYDCWTSKVEYYYNNAFCSDDAFIFTGKLLRCSRNNDKELYNYAIFLDFNSVYSNNQHNKCYYQNKT